jgi:hypothetical protein
MIISTSTCKLLPRSKLHGRSLAPLVASSLHTGNSFTFFLNGSPYERLKQAASTSTITPQKEKLQVEDELLVTASLTWRETWREETHRLLAGGKSLCVNRGEEHSRRWAEIILFEGGRVHRLIALPAFAYLRLRAS